MSSSICSFCAHRNPDGSRFCNACGSPLNLVPCPHCDAINNDADERCSRCGRPLLEPATAEVAAESAGYFESSPRRENAAVGLGAVPVALADRLVEQPWARAAERDTGVAIAEREPVAPSLDSEPVHTVSEVEPASTLSEAYADDPAEVLRPRPWDARANFNAGSPGRAKRIFLVLALVAVAGAVYWSTNPRMLADLQLLKRNAPAQEPAAAVPPATSAVAPAPASPASPTATSPSAAEPQPTAKAPEAQPSTAGAPESSASTPPAPPRPEATESSAPSKPTETSEAPPPVAPAQAAPPPEPKATTRPTARTGDDTRRASTTQQRAREQAERDAIATRRLIERDLGIAPRPGSTSAQ